MNSTAVGDEALVQNGTQSFSQTFIGIESIKEELERCQPTERDFNQALDMIEACSQALQDDPDNAIAYSDRALVLAFLGRDQEALRDQEQATRLGMDASKVKEDVALIRQIAIGVPDQPARALSVPGQAILSGISSMFGR